MELKEACAQTCGSEEDENTDLGKGVFCKRASTDLPPEDDDTQLEQGKANEVQQCGPVDNVGAECGIGTREGWRLCDRNCGNIASTPFPLASGISLLTC